MGKASGGGAIFSMVIRIEENGGQIEVQFCSADCLYAYTTQMESVLVNYMYAWDYVSMCVCVCVWSVLCLCFIRGKGIVIMH